MARNVAGEVAAVSVPAAVGFGLGLEAGPFAVVGQHPVGLELEQVAGAQLLRVLERAAGEPHGAQGERSGFHDRGVEHARCGDGLRAEQHRAAEHLERAGPEAELESATARQCHRRISKGVPSNTTARDASFVTRTAMRRGMGDSLRDPSANRSLRVRRTSFHSVSIRIHSPR